MAQSTCPKCGEQFERRNPQHVYCSRRCKVQHHYHEARPVPAAKSCARCGNDFTPPDRRPRIYCSKACQAQIHDGQRAGSKIESDSTCLAGDCDRSVQTRGYCEPHYRQMLPVLGRTKAKNPDSCSVEGCSDRPWARAMCAAHYQRWRRRGDAKAEPLRIRGRRCLAEGCEDRASAQGWCPAHYQRVLRDGVPGGPLDRLGKRTCGYCETPFDSPKMSRKYCSGECTTTAKSLHEAHRRYGITLQEYRAVWLRQGGACAICAQPERTERNRLLTIDHDHESGHVRGLLCSHCNRAIGLLQDDPKVIRAAADYVHRTRQIPLFVA